MNELLKQRLLRRLEALDDARAYQVLDYVEFLESKYGERGGSGGGTGVFTRITETAEDTLRAVGLPLKAISGTMGLMDSAGKVMRGVAAAAQAVVDEAVKAASPAPAAAPPPPPPVSPPPPAPPPAAGEATDGPAPA